MKAKSASHQRGIRALIRNTTGATAIEYGLIATLIAVGALASMKGLSNQLKASFTTTTNAISTATAA